MEHTALMKALLDLVVEAKGERHVDGGEVLLDLIELRCSTFGSSGKQSLLVVTYDDKGVASITTLAFTFLQEMTKDTMWLVAEGMDKKFFRPRYWTWHKKPRRVVDQPDGKMPTPLRDEDWFDRPFDILLVLDPQWTFGGYLYDIIDHMARKEREKYVVEGMLMEDA